MTVPMVLRAILFVGLFMLLACGGGHVNEFGVFQRHPPADPIGPLCPDKDEDCR